MTAKMFCSLFRSYPSIKILLLCYRNHALLSTGMFALVVLRFTHNTACRIKVVDADPTTQGNKKTGLLPVRLTRLTLFELLRTVSD